MPSNVYCPFCGVILLPDPYSDDPASLQTRVRPWYAEVRGIYSTNTAFGYITITGLGIIRCRNKLYAPLGNDLSYVDVGTEALRNGGFTNHLKAVGASAFTTRAGDCFSSGSVMDRMITSRMRRPLQSRSSTSSIALLVSKPPVSNLATTMRALRKHTNRSGGRRQWI